MTLEDLYLELLYSKDYYSLVDEEDTLDFYDEALLQDYYFNNLKEVE